jgi:outer membrane protein OmpA-like peptidoglycan-associated protein
MSRIRAAKSAWRRIARASSFAGVLIVGACQTAHHNLAPTEMIVSPTACADFTVTIYFSRGSRRLNREADTLLAEAAKQAFGCRVNSVEVEGLADAPGGPGINQALSKARTLAVTRVLILHGFSGFRFDPVDIGAGGQTRDDMANPLRRRVEVRFHLAPKP